MKTKMHKQEDKNQNNTNETLDNKDNNNTSGTEKEIISNKENETDPNGLSEMDGSAPGDLTDKVNAEIRAVQEKLAEMQDKYIRLSAEFDNYRKRTLREKMELSKYAEENILLKIVPLMDDFDRAVQHMENATDCNAMKAGIDLIYNKFGDFLKQNGIKEIESVNCDFNVDLHEAVAKVQVEEADKKGKVVDVVMKGYYLQDKVIRFSKVVVGE